jgi:hypothetical protein
MRRLRIRTLMLVVAALAVLLGSVGPARRAYRRWSFCRSQAAVYSRLEKKERLRASREQNLSADREAVRTTLMKAEDFQSKSSGQQEARINATVAFHQSQSKEARLAAERWAEKRRDCEVAALWCWDPYAPEAP